MAVLLVRAVLSDALAYGGDTCSVYLNDPLPQGRKGHRGEPEVREAEGNADDGDAVADPGDHVSDPEPDPGEDDPDNVRGIRTDNGLLSEGPRVDQRATEGPRREARDAKGSEGERNADHRDCQKAPKQQPGEAGEEATADNEVQEVEQESHVVARGKQLRDGRAS
jgi:hypothetical protein